MRWDGLKQCVTQVTGIGKREINHLFFLNLLCLDDNAVRLCYMPALPFPPERYNFGGKTVSDT